MKGKASLQRSLRKLKQKNILNETEYDKLYPASAPARIYSNPIMHKFSSSDSFPKLCLIVSSIGIFSCNCAHFLCDLLSPLVPKKFLVSYDVTSLFTNIPLQETINIAINLIFNHNLNLNITKKNLKKIFCFLLHHRLILFLTVSFIIKSME